MRVATTYRKHGYQVFHPASIGDGLITVACPRCRTRLECSVDLFAATSDEWILAAADCDCRYLHPAVLFDLRKTVKPDGAHIGWRLIKEPVIQSR